jgi:hypothetical protein
MDWIITPHPSPLLLGEGERGIRLKVGGLKLEIIVRRSLFMVRGQR